jgi:hypothetical protein
MSFESQAAKLFCNLSKSELEDLLKNPIIVEDGRTEQIQNLWNMRKKWDKVSLRFHFSDIVFPIMDTLKEMGKWVE